MEWISIVVILILVIVIILKSNKSPANVKSPSENANADAELESENRESKIDYKAVYQTKWLFTYNEKDMYTKLNAFAQKHDLTVFAKVRLFDLIEPRDNKDKSARYKIQAKHVDFVMCSNKLVAKYIIELDDQSHNSQSRKDRDSFVDEVLTACGYKILHLRAFDESALESLIGANQKQESE